MPIDLVDNPRFTRFIRTVNAGYQLPSKAEIQHALNSKAVERTSRVSDLLRAATSVALSQELLDTAEPGVKLAIFSAHYVVNWTYKHVVLSCHNVTTQVVSDKMAWNELKMSCLSSKPIEDVLLTVNNLMEEHHLPGFLSSAAPSTPLHEIPTGHSSYGSLLDRAVTSAVSKCGAVHDAIKRASSLITTAGVEWSLNVFRPSRKPWFEQLRLIDMVLHMDDSTKERILESSEHKLLSKDELSLLSSVIEVLRPFQEVAERLRSTNSVTCSLAFASIKLLKAALRDFDQAYPGLELVTELTKEFQVMTQTIDNGESNAYTIATILDPRFKLQWCESENLNHFKKCFIEAAKSVRTPKLEANEIEIKCAPFQSGGFFTRILKQQPESVQAGTITSEVLRYLDEPLVLEDCDIMSYWQANEPNFPHLSQLALCYLATPTSPSDVCKLFSLKDRIRTINSTTISGDVLKNVMELQSCLNSTL